MFNIIYNHRIFHHQIRQHLFHLINQSNQRMLTRIHISCKNINPDVNNIINCMFNYNCNSCSNVGGNWFN
jgi:hypothetical protein